LVLIKWVLISAEVHSSDDSNQSVTGRSQQVYTELRGSALLPTDQLPDASCEQERSEITIVADLDGYLGCSIRGYVTEGNRGSRFIVIGKTNRDL